MFKNLLLSTLAVSSSFSWMPTILSNINTNTLESDNQGLVSKISQKYQSENIDPSTINFSNVFNDIASSNFSEIFLKKLNINFQIYQTNGYGDNYLWYEGLHGNDMATAYENRIKNDVSNLLAYPLMMSVITDISHYYGENTQIKNRKEAVTNTINIISNVVDLIDNKNSDIKIHSKPKKEGNPHFVTSLKNLNINEIINDTLNQSYNNNLFNKYYNLDYESMELKYGNLHVCDDYFKDWGVSLSSYERELWDWFDFGPFRIWELNKIKVFGQYVGLWVTTNFSFYSPQLYDFQI